MKVLIVIVISLFVFFFLRWQQASDNKGTLELMQAVEWQISINSGSGTEHSGELKAWLDKHSMHPMSAAVREVYEVQRRSTKNTSQLLNLQAMLKTQKP